MQQEEEDYFSTSDRTYSLTNRKFGLKKALHKILNCNMKNDGYREAEFKIVITIFF